MAGGNELSHNSISLWGVVFYSISVISPAFTLTVGSVASIVYSGKAAPLSFVIAGLATFSAVIALYIYSEYVSNAGGYFKFIEAATQNAYISKTVGLWNLSVIVGSVIMGAGVVAWFVNGALNILFGLTLSIYYLVAISLIVPFLYLITGYFRIKSVARTAITIGILQIAVFTSFAIGLVIRTPYNSDLYFSIGNSTDGLHGFFLAMIIGAFFSYGGYGSIVSLGEEVKFSKKTMKRAIVYALVIMIFFETFAVYAIVAAAGPNLSLLSNSIAPSLYLGKLYFGANISFIIFIVGLLGIMFSLALGGNSGARGAFALARDGLLPSSFTRIHKRYKSPYVAVIWTFIFSIIGIVLTETITVTFLGFNNGLFYSWAIWGTSLVFFSLILSITTNSSLVFFIRRIRRKVNVLAHIGGPSISTAIMMIAIFYSLYGLKGPLVFVYWIILCLFIFDFAAVYVRRDKMRTEKLEELLSR